jgi:hypothetical protein
VSILDYKVRIIGTRESELGKYSFWIKDCVFVDFEGAAYRIGRIRGAILGGVFGVLSRSLKDRGKIYGPSSTDSFHIESVSQDTDFSPGIPSARDEYVISVHDVRFK